MKKFLAILLIAGIIFSLVSCSSSGKDEVKKAEYTLSTDVKEGSVIDGVMTDIDGDDPVLEKSNASWLDTCVLYEVNIRQYTEEGTFAAFEEHLDRLKEMGINTLWLMPIHPISKTDRKGTLGSYYSVDDYMEVNPEFGTMEEFQHLVDKAHDMGFKVMLDWVANHTGWDNAWIKEHDDWYTHDDSGEIISPNGWTDTADLNYDNYEMRAEMIKCMQFWVEEVGIDGFRCDHAIGVPAKFWNAAVYKLKSVNSDIVMLAEAAPAHGLTEYAFDLCYNDKLYSMARSIRGGVDTDGLQDAMTVSPNYYDPGSYPMNYLDNHDKNSYEGSIIYRFEDTYQPLLALSYLSPGVPLVYTSDEEGYDHEIEFFEKDAVKWDDNPKYAELITKLSKLKTENPALVTSNTDLTFIEPENSNVFAFKRSDGENTVVYIGNLYKEAAKDVTVNLGIEKATCVLHHDGTTLDTEEKEMTNSDFENKDYNPYEFYVLVVKS